MSGGSSKFEARVQGAGAECLGRKQKGAPSRAAVPFASQDRINLLIGMRAIEGGVVEIYVSEVVCDRCSSFEFEFEFNSPVDRSSAPLRVLASGVTQPMGVRSLASLFPGHVVRSWRAANLGLANATPAEGKLGEGPGLRERAEAIRRGLAFGVPTRRSTSPRSVTAPATGAAASSDTNP